jgi:sec-independent protein translocase protein TatA
MEIAVVRVIALLVLEPKRLPAAGRSLGEGIRELRDAITNRGQDTLHEQPVQLAVGREAVCRDESTRDPRPRHRAGGCV